MARKPNPWWWDDESGWYVNYQGRRRFLGKHPEGASKPKKSEKTGHWNAPKDIEEAFRALLDDKTSAPRSTGGDAVVQVLDDFVTWCKENRAPITASRYEQFCQDFVRTTENGVKFGALPVSQLTSKHVTAWLGQRTTWGATTKKNAITALQAAFNWAVQNRGLEKNPIKGMKKPEANRRSDVVTTVEFDEMLSVIHDEQFRDLLIVPYDCGARPFEVKDLEKRHVQSDKQRAVIPADEAKGRKHTRTVYFPTGRSMDMVKRLCEEYPTGPLFRNKSGNRWTGDAVKCRFENIEIAFGLREMERQGIELDVSEESITAFMEKLSPTKKQRGTGREAPKENWELRKEARLKLIAEQARKYGKRFNHYAFRRTFITRKIIAGVDSHVVAKLSGHQSTAMIDRHYSAVANDHEFMLKMAAQDIPAGDRSAVPNPETGS
jgi:integrase